MNERIKELAEQSGLEFDDDLTLVPEPIYYATQTDVYKFAELVIRECIAVHKDDYGVDIIGDVLKKHFGVE